MKNLEIEWTDHTLNLWLGCTKVHAGCDNCYAEALAKRFGHAKWGDKVPRVMVKSAFPNLSKWQRKAEKDGMVFKIFCGSMMDIFEKPKPVVDHKGSRLDSTTEDLRAELFSRIRNGEYPNLRFQLLTNRPSNINKYIPKSWVKNPPLNVMYGTSPVDQGTFDNLIKHMGHVNGQKFLSVEPQLGHICLHSCDDINWIIQGGESGHGRRPFDYAWAYELRNQCKELGIEYFFKQIDKVQRIPEDMLVREFPIWQADIQKQVA